MENQNQTADVESTVMTPKRSVPEYPDRGLAIFNLGLLTVAFISFDTFAATSWETDHVFELCVVLGVVFAQVTLVAVWSVFGAANLAVRFGGGFGISALLSVISALAYTRNFFGGHGAEAWSFGGTAMGIWVTLQIPLWCMRFSAGWQLGNSGVNRKDRSQALSRFGLKQLLLWFVAIGVWLAILRSLVPQVAYGDSSDTEFRIVTFTLFVLFNSMFALPVFWATMTDRNWLAWLVVSATCMVPLTIAEGQTFQYAAGVNEDYSELWLINGIHYICVAVTLMFLRAYGVRLMRNSS